MVWYFVEHRDNFTFNLLVIRYCGIKLNKMYAYSTACRVA
jgi:hypothetical protein